MFGGFYECSITLIDCCLSSQIRCKPWDINIIIKKETTRKPLGIPVSYLSIFEKYILNTRCVRQWTTTSFLNPSRILLIYLAKPHKGGS